MIEPTPYQDRLLKVPETFNICAAGGRGGGKTVGCVQFMSLSHIERWQEKARVLILRESLPGLREIEDDLDLLFRIAYGNAVRGNRQEHIWRMPNGAIVEAGYLDAASDFHRYAGKNYSLIIVEEAGQARTFKWIDMMQSCLRVPGVPCRMVLLANPAGRSHATIHSRYIAGHAPWVKFEIAGEKWIWCPSTWRDNKHLPADYRSKLAASCGKDKELLKAWESGDWNVLRGAYFGDVLDEKHQAIDAPGFSLPDDRIYSFLAADWGSSAPAVAFACARLLAPVGKYPRGSLILLDEVSSADPDDLSVGLRWSPGRFADAMRAMADRNRVDRGGVLDDAKGLGADETLIRFMNSVGLYFRKPMKSRVQGWQMLRELMTNAKEQNGRPGIWISTKCTGFWATAPSCPRDSNHPEDLDTSAIDHFLDAARYAATDIPQFAVMSHHCRF